MTASGRLPTPPERLKADKTVLKGPLGVLSTLGRRRRPRRANVTADGSGHPSFRPGWSLGQKPRSANGRLRVLELADRAEHQNRCQSVRCTYSASTNTVPRLSTPPNSVVP